MVDQLNSFASEVTRVAREVGTEGKLGGQAQVEGVAGTWKDLTDNVNSMAANLTGQVRNIAEVTTAVANGDLSKKITVDVKGEILELKNTINTMVDQLNSFASEVTRVAREVGTEGKLGGQAQVQGVAGTWKDLTDNVNFMAGNLTGQVRNIAEVTTAVANGDLSKKITVDVQGRDPGAEEHHQHHGGPAELLRLGSDARGARGRHRGQARRPGPGAGVAGTWKDLTDNVNLMAGNLTGQVRNIAEVTTAVAKGDLSKKITVDVQGRDPRAEEHHQHHGGPAELLRLGSDARGARGRHRRQARRPGAGARRRRHLEGPDRQREHDGRQPDQPGARHRRRGDRGGPGQPEAQADRRRQGRDRLAGRHHQRHDRDAGHLRRPGDQRGPRGRYRRQARRPGAGARRRRPVARPDRQRQPAGRQPDHPGARHRRGVDRGDQGRPDPLDHRRSLGRGGGAEGQHQRDDPQPEGSDAEEHRAGLAEDQPRPVHPHAAGRARPLDGVEPGAVGAGAAGQRPARRVLRHRPGRGRQHGAQPGGQLRLQQPQAPGAPVQAARGPDRPVRLREVAHPAHQRAAGTTSRSPRASARPRRSTSSCCRSCSKARSRR